MPIRDYSQTAASNTSISSINIGEGCPPSNINDAIRQALADIREVQANSTIASASTVNIGAANAEYLAVSGTTTITAFDSVAAGVYRVLKFDGALTLTHNATSLILPGGASITTAANDVGGFRSLGSGNWRCEWYSKASGLPTSTTFPTVDINGGTIDGAVIGGASAAAGTFTTATVGAGLVGTPSLTTTGDTNTGLYFPAADTIAATTGGTERMRITSAGDVAIGINAAASKLHVYGGASGADTRVTVGNAASTLQVGVDSSNNSIIANNTANALGIYINSTERMRITSSGDVGIGTSSPGAKLEVAGTLTATGNTINFGGNDTINTIINVGGVPTGNKFSLTDYIGDTTYTDFGLRVGRVSDGANGTSLLQHRGTGSMILDVFDAGSLVAKTSSLERMRIDSSGNVGIGTSSPTFKLVAANSTTDGVWLYSSGAVSILGLGGYSGATDGAASIRYDRATGAITLNGGNRDSQSERMRIDYLGNVGIGTSSPAYKLDLNGALRMPNATVLWMNDSTGTAKETLQLYSDNNTYLSTPTALILRTNGTTERMRIDASGNVRIGTAALATTATDGFLYVPTCAGTPTGTPTAITGLAPIVINTTNNKLYFYSGGAWRDAGP